MMKKGGEEEELCKETKKEWLERYRKNFMVMLFQKPEESKGFKKELICNAQ
jgi:hypothetical protein